MDLSNIPSPVLSVALACRDEQQPVLDSSWLVKPQFLIYQPTLHVVERTSGAVRQGSLSLSRQQSAKGERTYKAVAFSLRGQTHRIHLGRER